MERCLLERCLHFSRQKGVHDGSGEIFAWWRDGLENMLKNLLSLLCFALTEFSSHDKNLPCCLRSFWRSADVCIPNLYFLSCFVSLLPIRQLWKLSWKSSSLLNLSAGTQLRPVCRCFSTHYLIRQSKMFCTRVFHCFFFMNQWFLLKIMIIII